jgi:hypothetical protein
MTAMEDLPMYMMLAGGRGMALMAIVTFAMKLLEHFKLKPFIETWFRKSFWSTEVKVTLIAKTEQDDLTMSTRFRAVVHRFKTILEEDHDKAFWKDVAYVEEIRMYQPTATTVNIFVGKIRVGDLTFVVTHEEKFIGEKKDKEHVKWTIDICGPDYGVVKAFLKSCSNEYDDYLSKDCDTNSRQMAYVLQSVSKRYGVRYSTSPFRSTKTFDNLFFPGKDSLIKKLDRFQNDEAYYNRVGKPYKMCMMFHSSPGAGKTSCLKALANRTKRHVVILSVDKLKSASDLCTAISTFSVDQRVPMNRCMFVIEEFDCWSTKVTRDDSSEAASDTLRDFQIVNAIKDLKRHQYEDGSSSEAGDPQETAETATGVMLNMFDGIKELHGALIVFTSNHPDKFDPALTRPGRIDKVEFRRLDACHVAEYWRLHFGEGVPSDLDAALRGKTDFISVAELSAILESDDPEASLKAFVA